tara:strand:+ start:1898 stop:2008 length:111 start_codon:yes stop_codon:yes gene_type:complete
MDQIGISIAIGVAVIICSAIIICITKDVINIIKGKV